jgi:hypothetical protein
MQENEQESQAKNQDSGLNLRASFARFDPDSCIWKTSQLSLFEESAASSLTWPAAGSMRNGAAFARPTLAPCTSAIGGFAMGGWPTPTAKDSACSVANGGVTLTDAVRRVHLADFPTPTAAPYGSSGNGSGSNTASRARPSLWTQARQGAVPSTHSGGTVYPRPAFVEALMGLPTSWTACDASGMP